MQLNAKKGTSQRTDLLGCGHLLLLISSRQCMSRDVVLASVAVASRRSDEELMTVMSRRTSRDLAEKRSDAGAMLAH